MDVVQFIGFVGYTISYGFENPPLRYESNGFYACCSIVKPPKKALFALISTEPL